MILEFLKTPRKKEELAIALSVLWEFKQCESEAEWIAIPFVAWAKLEQLEEFLAHLVDGAPLNQDTIARLEESKKEPPR